VGGKGEEGEGEGEGGARERGGVGVMGRAKWREKA